MFEEDPLYKYKPTHNEKHYVKVRGPDKHGLIYAVCGIYAHYWVSEFIKPVFPEKAKWATLNTSETTCPDCIEIIKKEQNVK